MANYSGIYQVWTTIIDRIVLSTDNKVKYNPDDFSLYQNYSNPFKPATSIKYSIGKESFVTLKVYDALGREVKTLVSRVQHPGEYKVSIKANNLSTGIYFYTLRSDKYQSTKKMLLLK